MAASNMAALQREIIDKMTKAMKIVNTKSEAIMYEEVGSFYTQGKPKIYVRTGALANSPKVTNVSSGGNTVSFEALLEPPDYNVPNPAFTNIGLPSNFTGEDVLYAAENHKSGVLGKPGFWKRSTKRIEKELDSTMGQFFR